MPNKKSKPTPVMRINAKDIKDRPFSESEEARISYEAMNLTPTEIQNLRQYQQMKPALDTLRQIKQIEASVGGAHILREMERREKAIIYPT